MRIAIITGASSGLGAEFARQLDKRQEIQQFWLIARRKERLAQLAGQLTTPSVLLDLDLTSKDAVSAIEGKLKSERPVVEILINAAGMGKIGAVEDIPLADDENMVDLNCRAAIAVTKICLPYLVKGSRILEICSTAGFQPLSGLAVYAASKAFLVRYSKALHYELRHRGISVTAVCPYWIKDTEFISIASQTDHNRSRRFPLTETSQKVVRTALRDSQWNLWVSTPGIVPTLHRLVTKILPDFITVPAADFTSKS